MGTILHNYGPAVAATCGDAIPSSTKTMWRMCSPPPCTGCGRTVSGSTCQKGSGAKGSLAALFYRIADNIVRNLLQKTGWHRLRLQEVRLEDWTESMAALPRPVDAGPSDAAAIRQDLQSVIDSLPAAYRYIVLADATAKDRVASAELIAEELEIPAGTVRVYRNRAMNAIRGKLRALGYEVP